jgi:phosphatidylglycerophosphatase A
MQRIVTLIATFFGSGFLPKMPGTWGSLAALPFAWLLWLLPLPLAGLVFTLACGVGIWAADQYVRQTDVQDNQQIVIDEVLGIFVTAFSARHDWISYTAVFFFFRLFDIWKPFPIRWLDHNIKGGLGVVVDDLCAGVFAMISVWALQQFI